MRVLPLCCLITALCLEGVGEVPRHTTFYRPSQAPAQDASLLRPEHLAYADAMEFARTLNDEGINVKSVHRSHFESFFRGIEKAAFFRTDKGIVEVIFFPDPVGAEKVEVRERRKAGR